MYLLIKRFFDFLFALIGLILIIPFMLPIMLALKLTGEGEVFFLQKRMGYKNKPFSIKKFATMLKDSEKIGNKTVTLRNDPRITKVGKYLRITKLNEIPQILNVLLGELSLVGARPLLVNSFKKYAQEVQAKIYQTRPGITGIGSLIFRDEEKLVSEATKIGFDPLDYYKKHIYPYKGALELWYQGNISFLTDFKILFLTFWQILFSKSNLPFRVFQNLPKRPSSLTVEGIKDLRPIAR